MRKKLCVLKALTKLKVDFFGGKNTESVYETQLQTKNKKSLEFSITKRYM
jgi:hypothetical protein